MIGPDKRQKSPSQQVGVCNFDFLDHIYSCASKTMGLQYQRTKLKQFLCKFKTIQNNYLVFNATHPPIARQHPSPPT